MSPNRSNPQQRHCSSSSSTATTTTTTMRRQLLSFLTVIVVQLVVVFPQTSQGQAMYSNLALQGDDAQCVEDSNNLFLESKELMDASIQFDMAMEMPQLDNNNKKEGAFFGLDEDTLLYYPTTALEMYRTVCTSHGGTLVVMDTTQLDCTIRSANPESNRIHITVQNSATCLATTPECQVFQAHSDYLIQEVVSEMGRMDCVVVAVDLVPTDMDTTTTTTTATTTTTTTTTHSELSEVMTITTDDYNNYVDDDIIDKDELCMNQTEYLYDDPDVDLYKAGYEFGSAMITSQGPSTMNLSFPFQAIVNFNLECDDVGGLFLLEELLLYDCTDIVNDIDNIQVSIQNSAQCVADTKACQEFSIAQLFYDMLYELNLNCTLLEEAYSGEMSGAEFRDFMAGKEDYDEGDDDDVYDDDDLVDDDDDDDVYDDDDDDDDNDDDDVDDDDVYDDNVDNDVDNDEGDDDDVYGGDATNDEDTDGTNASTSAASANKNNKSGGSKFGIFLLVVFCLAGICLVQRRRRRRNKQASHDIEMMSQDLRFVEQPQEDQNPQEEQASFNDIDINEPTTASRSSSPPRQIV